MIRNQVQVSIMAQGCHLKDEGTGARFVRWLVWVAILCLQKKLKPGMHDAGLCALRYKLFLPPTGASMQIMLACRVLVPAGNQHQHPGMVFRNSTGDTIGLGAD